MAPIRMRAETCAEAGRERSRTNSTANPSATIAAFRLRLTRDLPGQTAGRETTEPERAEHCHVGEHRRFEPGGPGEWKVAQGGATPSQPGEEHLGRQERRERMGRQSG